MPKCQKFKCDISSNFQTMCMQQNIFKRIDTALLLLINNTVMADMSQAEVLVKERFTEGFFS